MQAGIFQTTEPGKPNQIWLQPIQAAVLGSAKVSVNGELNLTNLIPRVNLDAPL
jgi:acyl CoA:acetate/3-ketoacid CoA transferase beta subunit